MAPAPQWLTNDFFKDIIKRAIDHEISISDDEIIAYISKNFFFSFSVISQFGLQMAIVN